MYNITDNEHEVLCEKIINDLHDVFLRERQLLSFEIIPTIINNQNKSPVIQMNQNIGLESWCVKHVYHYAHNVLLSLMRNHRNYNCKKFPNDDNGSADGRGILKNNNKSNLDEKSALLKYLNIALLINPDVISFWNWRRRLVIKNQLNIPDELKFTALVLSKKPKSNETFTYRRWLLATSSTHISTISQRNSQPIDWYLELNLCEYCADRCCNNYHAWAHRQWVLKTSNDANLIAREISFTEKFLLKHVGDYSAYYYRQFLISYAKQKNYYSTTEYDSKQNMQDLKTLLMQYMVQTNLDISSYTSSQILHLMLPDVNVDTALENVQLKSFLYCCDLSAHDINLMTEQKRLYGERESFELHSLASLRFIINQCQQCNLKEHVSSTNLMECQQKQHELLTAIQRKETLLGDHGRCKRRLLILGFTYKSFDSSEDDSHPTGADSITS